MRRSIVIVLVLLGSTPAFAEEPPLVAMPELDAESAIELRTGFADVDVSGFEWRATAVLLTKLRASYAVREDLEVSLAVGGALLLAGRDEFLPAPGYTLPALGVAWSRPVAPRWRVGAGAVGAIGGRSGDTFYTRYPGDVAAGVFFIDPEVVWTRAHMGLVRGGAAWSDGETTLALDLGLQAYTGGDLPETVSILRLSGGVARRLGGRVSASLEALLSSDLHQESLGDGTDVIPALTAGVRRAGTWEVGVGMSYAWRQARPDAGEAGLSFLVDVSRKY